MHTQSSLNRKSVSSRSIKVGILQGGDSSERPISIRSGRAVFQALSAAGFSCQTLDPRNKEIFTRHLRAIDVAFVALHGTGGEDGKIQSLLERQRIPYVGSGPRPCRVSFNKHESKKLFGKAGIPTPEAVVLNRDNWERRAARFGAPFFVKPLEEGSSVGVFAVDDLKRSKTLIRKAFRSYERLLFERKIQGREVTVGILGRKALPVVELRPKRLFYDYRAKYTRGMCRYLIPAPLPEPKVRQLQRLARRAHQVLDLRDFSRVDFMLDAENRPFVLEVNAIPGLTEMSLLPKAAREAGISFEAMCTSLIEMAVRRNLMNQSRG